MTTEEVFEEYGDVELFFSHYYNFIFVYKSARLDNGDQIYLHLGGSMEKVSAMVVDVEDPLHDDGAGEQKAEVDDQEGHDGQHGVAQGMLADDAMAR